MKDCERIEVALSALLDGELPAGEQREVLAHLLDCADCRRFYQEAGALQAELDLLPPAAWPAAPRRAWPSPGSRHWLQAAAMVGMLALGLGLGARLGAGTGTGAVAASALPREGEIIELALGSDAGAMDDREFMAITLRLLRADPRYSRELAAILARVMPAPLPGEASAGDFELTGEETGGERPAAESRVIY